MTEQVILVDSSDNEIGVSEKMEAHSKALLHRAFSVFIFNEKGEMLIHQRALHKYHSGGKWTNACCGHPRPGEDTLLAAQRRLNEEMGITCELKKAFSFTYTAKLDDELTENEIDHVYIGWYRYEPVLNTEEVMNYKWISINDLYTQLNTEPDIFTEWFKICIDQVIKTQKKQ